MADAEPSGRDGHGLRRRNVVGCSSIAGEPGLLKLQTIRERAECGQRSFAKPRLQWNS
jgi:hypothetical protein